MNHWYTLFCYRCNNEIGFTQSSCPGPTYCCLECHEMEVNEQASEADVERAWNGQK